jgi:dephospho-CoA kinase
MIIGLTGKYCSGKNHIAALLEIRGFPVLDVDKLGYQALISEKEAIISLFGADLAAPGTNWQPETAEGRKLLGRLVFGNPEKLAALEAIIHPAANKLTEEWVAAQKGHCVVNAALLHRSSIFHKLNRIILVKAPFFTRFLRAQKRDKLSCLEILKRFASQKGFNTQYLSKKAEIYRIANPGFFIARKLECQIDKLIRGI